MNSHEDLLNFMDFLDLDEDIIDRRLKSLMVKDSHTNKQLANIIQLLLYKNLVNSQECTECDNEEEFGFVVRLFANVCDDNVEQISKIINIILCLNPSTMVRKSEHLLQQILSNLDFQPESGAESQNYLLTTLKICDSVLEAVIKNGDRINLMFFENPLVNILNYSNDKLKILFLNSVVPKLIEGVVGYNILDSIWVYLMECKKDSKDEALLILSTLSEYYLPIFDKKEDRKFESEVIFQYYFWDTVLFGLNSNDATLRKISIYLAKKGVECALQSKMDINVFNEHTTLFTWKAKDENVLKNMWDNFFILMDSLEEKQSNIVLPSLKLFDVVNIGDCWITCAYNMGLKHDNMQIKMKCLEYRFKTRISNEIEAIVLLETLNDINLYDNIGEYERIKKGIHKMFEDRASFLEIIKAIPKTKWSPVPFYHLTDVLSKQRLQFNNNEIFIAIIDVLKTSCNNIAIRRAAHVNILHFIKNCILLDWKQLANIHSITQINGFINKEHPIVALVETIVLSNEETSSFYIHLSETKNTLDFVLYYLSNHVEDKHIFANVINEKVRNILDIVNRQYSDKKKCFNDVIFLLHLLKETLNEKDPIMVMLNALVSSQYKYLILYLIDILSGDTKFHIKEIIEMFTVFSFDAHIENTGEDLLKLYKASIMILKDTCDLDKVVASVFVIAKSLKDSILIQNFMHEMIDIKGFMNILGKYKFSENSSQSVGRYRNAFYEKSCEILYHLIKEHNDCDLKEIIIFIEKVLECGGYGCLNWILKIANEVAKELINNNFNMIQFINKTWNEIEELKSNNQHTPCIVEFINLITNDAILQKSVHNNVVMLYCNKIIEYGPLRNTPLYYLTVKLQTKNIDDCGHLLYVLCEILLYCPVLKKDQRITDNVTLEILQNPKFGMEESNINNHFNYEILYLAATILSKISNAETLEAISTFIISRIEEMFKNKQRYHGHSHLHKILLRSLQHLLILVIKQRNHQSEKVLNWSLELLSKLPHQQSVKICLEWIIALNLYMREVKINAQMIELLKTYNVPLLSQFSITYSLLKQKVSNNSHTEEEYNFVLDLLTSNTMGPLFNIRLNAQYLALKVFHLVTKTNKHTYAYTINIIERTLAENANDKNFVKLKNDYFLNEFNIVDNLTPWFIYYYLPRYCEGSNNETENEKFVKDVMYDIEHTLSQTINESNFTREWLKRHNKNDEFIKFNIEIEYDVTDNDEKIGTIQKKYIPWKNMSDINVYDIGKKKETVGDLIVVASLIDKLPNLGGMARTSEVFGVKTYVVDSLRHLQDKQFQGLSVSAERWIDVEEVRPGKPLKEYLIKKKVEGYSVIAAEQTSNSCKLQSFKFPKKTLLLLGHEKEGIPCDLLPMMDHCVEIPQQGFVRSLNVHVTAAIFVWEYTRQNIL